MKVKKKFLEVISLAAIFGIMTIAISLFFMHTANADPVLNVSVSSGLVLLGGQASYTVSVTNTDPNDKGYNLSFSSIFSSDRTNPEGQVTFHSASDARGDLAPTSAVTDAGTGDTTIDFINLKDISPNETYTFTLMVDMSGDITWEAMDDLMHDITATVNTMPDGSGSDISGIDSDTADVLPIALVEKITRQTTGVEQATGTIDRPYSYQIDVQNNYTNATDNVIMTDTLPDGIEFLGITSGHACTDSRNVTTGITTIVCNLGTMAASELQVIEFDAGIRYDYFGTDNGGTNRVHDDFDGIPPTGTPIPDKTVFTNHVDLDAEYDGSAVPTQSDDALVTAAYATVSKSENISGGGHGDTVNYTLTYTTSEYYNILDDNIDNNTSSITLHDLLPDGQTFLPATSNETSYAENGGDGTTDIYWNSSVLNALDHSDSFDITFSATIDSTWNDGSPIVAADRMTNTVDSHGEWDDQVDIGRPNEMTNSSASVSFGMETPPITKEVEDINNPGTWITATDAVVGDDMRFRVRFNTNDGANPVVSNVELGDIVVTDWLPNGMSFVPGSAIETYSAAGDFTDGGDPDTESAVTIGSLNGVEWILGDVEQGGWWQATFIATVDDTAVVTDGAEVNNIWKMAGLNSFDEAYSDRSIVAVTYREPHLLLDKSISNSPSPLKPGDNVEYTVTIQNTGTAVAKDIVFTDIVSSNMDDTTPTVTNIDLNGANLTEGTGYVTPVWTAGTHTFDIDFSDGGIETNIPIGETLTIVYQATVNNDVGAGVWLHNTATASYDTQTDGSGRTVPGTANTADDNTDNASIGLPDATSSKSVSAGPFTIGDSITYTIDTTIPQGQIVYWPEIIDEVNMDGVVYIPNSAALSLVSGTPVTGASFDATTNPDPIIDLVGNDSSDFLWNFASPIDNRGQATDYVFRLTFNVQYTGLEDNGTDWELFPPTAGDQIENIAVFAWADYPAGARITNGAAFAPSVTSDIDQPLLATAKTVTSAGPYTAGSTIDYQVVITNDGESTAYDIIWEDNLAGGAGSATLTSITHSAIGALVSGAGFQENFGGNPLAIDFDGGTSDTHMAPGETITIVYSATANNNIGAGASVENTADVDWSSRDGVVAGERIYNDAAQEGAYTADTDNASIVISGATFSKSITSPASGTAEIGETVTYQLHVTVPSETVLYSPTIQDVITDNGMEYVNGSVAIAPVSGNPEVPATISAAPTVDTANPNPGATIDFVFDNNIDNANVGVQGDTEYIFDVTYQMVVTGLDDASNWIANPTSTNNTATITWSDGTNNHSENDNALLNIVEPHLALVKNFDVENVVGGDTVTATVVITNDGNGTAYELDSGADFTDTMPDGFTNPQMVSVTHSVNGLLADPADYTFTATGNDFTLEYNSSQTDLAAGEILTLVYTTDIDTTIGAGVNISNSADADYSSMSGAQINERVFDDTNPAEDTTDEDSDNVVTPSATMTKTTTLGSGEATIGEEFDYIITIDVPANTTVYNAEVRDVVPDGLTVVGTTQSPDVGIITAIEQLNGTTPITWDVGDISNNPTSQIILTINVRVDNDYSDTSLLDGLPVGIDGDAQDTLTNAGVFNWDNADVSGTTHVLNDDVTVTIVEPHPTITKDVNSNAAGIGDTMNYTVVIANDGTSTLYNINWDDTLPAELFNAGTSPTLTSVTHSVDGLLVEGTDYNSNFGVNPMTIGFNVVPETSLVPGEAVTILYDAIVENTVSAGDILTNNARIVFAASQPNSNPNRRSYFGSDSESVTIASTSIGNKVWHDNNKDGIQDVGELGIQGVSVELRDSAGNSIDDPINPGTPYIVQTDADGEYLFTNLTAGDYRVYFNTPTGYAHTSQDQGGDDALDSDMNVATNMTDTFTLSHNEHITHIDAGFTTASITNFTWLDVNGDGIQDGGDTWYPGVTVHLLDGSGNPVDDPSNPGTPYTLVTNGAGNCVFENLLAGDYQTQFDVPAGFSFSPQDQGGNDLVDSDADTTGRTATITLTAGEDRTSIDAGLYQPVSLGDTVWQDNDADGIQDGGEPGVDGVVVRLLDGAGNPVDNPSNPGNNYEVTTDGSGNYLFENLLPGDYQIEVVTPANYHLSPQDNSGDEATDSDINIVTNRSNVVALDSGDNDTTLDAGMYQLASIGDKVWRDDERDGIQAPWEPGLEGALVELLDGAGNPVDEPGNPGTPYTITTGADGNYLFENLLPGDYQIMLTPPADHNPADKDQGGDDTLDSDIDTMTLTTDTVTLVSGENNTDTDAGFYALYANVFDPPSAIKEVSDSGESEIEWKMVWINDGNMVAVNTQILDNVPTGTTYVNGSVFCEARGLSATSICTYDIVENRIRWEGDIAPDPGGTTENNTLNELVITYRTTVPAEMETVENQATAQWDANGDGDFNDDIARGQTPAVTDDTNLHGTDPTVWTRADDEEGDGSIGNTIWLDLNSNGKQDKGEPGLEDIRVKLVDDKGRVVARTDTNHNGHYKFENLPKGKYKVIVKAEDVAKYIQTYDPDSRMNGKDTVRLRDGQNYTKADFGYNLQEETLARTGDNSLINLILVTLAGMLTIGWAIRKRAIN